MADPEVGIVFKQWKAKELWKIASGKITPGWVCTRQGKRL